MRKKLWWQSCKFWLFGVYVPGFIIVLGGALSNNVRLAITGDILIGVYFAVILIGPDWLKKREKKRADRDRI